MSDDNDIISGEIEASLSTDGKRQMVDLRLTDSGATISLSWPYGMTTEQKERLSAVLANVTPIIDGLFEGMDDDPDSPVYAINLP